MPHTHLEEITVDTQLGEECIAGGIPRRAVVNISRTLTGTDRRFPLVVVQGGIQETALFLAQLPSIVQCCTEFLSIRNLPVDVHGILTLREYARIGMGIGLIGRIVGPVTDDGTTFIDVAIQLDVQHTGDGIRSILGGGSVPQQFDPVDRSCRDGVQVRTHGSAAHRTIHVDQRGSVTTLAVHEYQGLIGTETSDGGRIDVVRSIRHRLRGGIEGRCDVVQDVRDVRLRCFHHQTFQVQHVHRCGRFQFRPRQTACTRHDHLIDVSGTGLKADGNVRLRTEFNRARLVSGEADLQDISGRSLNGELSGFIGEPARFGTLDGDRGARHGLACFVLDRSGIGFLLCHGGCPQKEHHQQGLNDLHEHLFWFVQ